MSMRGGDFPTYLYCAFDFSTGDADGVYVEASATSSPYRADLPEAACITLPKSVVHCDGSTFQRAAAALTSISRAAAAAKRIPKYPVARTDAEPPVTCV